MPSSRAAATARLLNRAPRFVISSRSYMSPTSKSWTPARGQERIRFNLADAGRLTESRQSPRNGAEPGGGSSSTAGLLPASPWAARGTGGVRGAARSRGQVRRGPEPRSVRTCRRGRAAPRRMRGGSRSLAAEPSFFLSVPPRPSGGRRLVLAGGEHREGFSG